MDCPTEPFKLEPAFEGSSMQRMGMRTSEKSGASDAEEAGSGRSGWTSKPNAQRYRCIVADPPWKYEGFASDPTSGRDLPDEQRKPIAIEALPYRSMSVEEICALPVAKMADADCRLFLWTTNRYLLDGFRVMAAWGFGYKQTLVWRKTGNPSPFGGSVAPNHAEYLLVGTRGNPPVLARAKSNVMDAPAQRRHSAKPELMTDMIMEVSPGPYLELFARRNRLGWHTWGNEALAHVSLGGGGAEQVGDDDGESQSRASSHTVRMSEGEP